MRLPVTTAAAAGAAAAVGAAAFMYDPYPDGLYAGGCAVMTSKARTKFVRHKRIHRATCWMPSDAG